MTIRMGDAVFATGLVDVQGREATGWVRYIRENGVAEVQLDKPQVFGYQPGWRQNATFGTPLRVLYWPREHLRLDPTRPNRAQPVPKKAQP